MYNNKTKKYEVVIGVPDDKFVNGKNQDQIKIMIDDFQLYLLFHTRDLLGKLQ